MAFITITPQAAYSVGWSNPEGAFADDGNLAISPTDGSILRLYKFTKTLPKNITITGLEVGGHASLASSLAGTTLSVYMSYDGVNAISSTKTSTGFTTTETPFLLGGAGDLWGFTPKRPRLENADFSLLAYSSGASGLIQLDDLYLTVYYTANSYLRGERSNFSSELDTLVKVSNGAGPEHQIKSEQVNTVGDCLYAIETNLLSGISNVKAVGYPPGKILAAVSVSVTGSLASGSVTAYFHGLKATPGGIASVTSPDFSSISGTRLPYSSVQCHLVSAVGWVVSGGAVTQAAFVSPRGLFIEKSQTTVNEEPVFDYRYSFGFTAVGEAICNTRTSLTNDGFNGVYMTGYPLNNGTLIVKMFGLGVVT